MMKSLYNKDAKLESHRFFPIIAWVLVFGFVFFVYNLVQDLRATATELSKQNHELSTKASLEAKNITDFSR